MQIAGRYSFNGGFEAVTKTGIEIVPVKALADQMSSGVSYFEQFVWDLEKRGVSNIDTPVLILGVDCSCE